MRTNLIGKSNAVLMSDGEFIAIIGCGAKTDITKKLALAIKEHFVVKKVMVERSAEIDKKKAVNFTAEIIDEDGDVEYRDFEIFITATY